MTRQSRCRASSGAVDWLCLGKPPCHDSELFPQSPRRKAFADEGLPECEMCHEDRDIDPPADEMLGVGLESICIDCHEPKSQEYRVVAQLDKKIDSLRSRIGMADSLLQVAQKAGMEVRHLLFKLGGARRFLIQGCTTMHALSVVMLDTLTHQGIQSAEAAHREAGAALDELQFRCVGFAFYWFLWSF